MLRAILTAMILLAGWLAIPTLASASDQRYASIVVDADTHEILHARQIDELRFPASLTKAMTLYLTFDALNSGALKLGEKVRVSSTAARTPPTRLGLKAGQTISVEKLIQSVAIKSANDSAVVLAERLAGSEAAFAAQMTAKARSLGMLKTTFKTANGLPHPEQKTSARDMAKLASNILQHHRRYYHYFGLANFSYNGRTYKNTNSLLHWLNGVDGFKTGYTRDSGYNLIISAQRDGRRLIAVVLGGASGAARDSHMKDLVELGFNVMGVAPVMSLPPVEIVRSPTPSLKQAELARTQAVRLRGHDSQPVTVVSEGKSMKISAREDIWGIQIGAFLDEEKAREQVSAVDGVTGLKGGTVLPLSRNGQTLYRARFENLTVTQAQNACKALAQLASGCLIVASN